MKKLIHYLLSGLLLALFLPSQAQNRYLDQIFTQVSVTPAIYGSNFTVLTISTTGHTARQPLVMDVYQPVGDTEVARPLIIYCHTGNFLPWLNPATGVTINGACGGTKNDPGAVETCTRLAKMGYVVASIDYRLGWRPDLLQEIQRRFTLINAAYRGVQDARTCIRFFRKSVAESGNPFKIDPNKIAIWGQGTGGYLSLNTAALDKYSEIITTSEPGKFMLNATTPMVIEAYNGDPYGVQTTPGIVDALYGAVTGFPVGDTLYVPNHIGYSSDFNLAINMGGALGDKAWLDANTPPILSFHVPLDPFAPCGDGTVIVPGFNFAVVNVTGSCGVQPIMDGLNNNDVFEQPGLLSDNLSTYARTINNNTEAFYPLFRAPDDSAPWEWNKIVPIGPTGPLDCNTDSTVARMTIDTIIAYYAPRGCRALGLGCPGISVSTENLFDADNVLVIQPNPAKSEMLFTTDADHPILAVELYDAAGRLVRNERAVHSSLYTLQRGVLNSGIYVAKIYFENGVSARKVIFE